MSVLVICGPKKGQHHKAQYKFTTTLVSCKPMQLCIASITNYITAHTVV